MRLVGRRRKGTSGTSGLMASVARWCGSVTACWRRSGGLHGHTHAGRQRRPERAHAAPYERLDCRTARQGPGFPRPLRYSPKRPHGEEKGVDVELAIDIVSLALDDLFDVCVLASADTDLVPSLQLVADRFPDKTLVTLGLEPLPGCLRIACALRRRCLTGHGLTKTYCHDV